MDAGSRRRSPSRRRAALPGAASGQGALIAAFYERFRRNERTSSSPDMVGAGSSACMPPGNAALSSVPTAPGLTFDPWPARPRPARSANPVFFSACSAITVVSGPGQVLKKTHPTPRSTSWRGRNGRLRAERGGVHRRRDGRTSRAGRGPPAMMGDPSHLGRANGGRASRAWPGRLGARCVLAAPFSHPHFHHFFYTAPRGPEKRFRPLISSTESRIRAARKMVENGDKWSKKMVAPAFLWFTLGGAAAKRPNHRRRFRNWRIGAQYNTPPPASPTILVIRSSAGRRGTTGGVRVIHALETGCRRPRVGPPCPRCRRTDPPPTACHPPAPPPHPCPPEAACLAAAARCGRRAWVSAPTEAWDHHLRRVALLAALIGPFARRKPGPRHRPWSPSSRTSGRTFGELLVEGSPPGAISVRSLRLGPLWRSRPRFPTWPPEHVHHVPAHPCMDLTSGVAARDLPTRMNLVHGCGPPWGPPSLFPSRCRGRRHLPHRPGKATSRWPVGSHQFWVVAADDQRTARNSPESHRPAPLA